jgi:CHAT domain-containing protein
VVLSSASSLKLLAHATRQRPSNDSILLVGNAPTVEEDYPSLPHASAEIAGIKRYFEHNVVLDNQGATPAAYHASDPGRFEYIHFVAHGIASRERPLESAVVLARDAKGYKLFARDIIDVPLHARLVTISSCHGAGTRTYTGEGLVGLAWAFLAAGSENVIGALWEVKDVTTPKLMEHMYGALREGNDPAVALRKAKLELVRSGTLRSKPLYWAPFVLYTGS